MNMKSYLLALLFFANISLQPGYADDHFRSTAGSIGEMTLAFDGAERISQLELEIIKSNLTVQNYLNGDFEEDNGKR